MDFNMVLGSVWLLIALIIKRYHNPGISQDFAFWSSFIIANIYLASII